MVCLAPPHATARCADARCTYDCERNFMREGSQCVAIPRPLGPMSTSTVTSRRPTLRWELGSAARASIELCRDRALTTGCLNFDVAGTSVAPTVDLTPGVWFWRVTAHRTDPATVTVGPTWLFHVGFRSAPVDTSWVSSLDVNGDGYGDVVTKEYNFGVDLFLGSASGAMMQSRFLPPWSFDLEDRVFNAGDVNGDGYGDILVSTSRSLQRAVVYRGGSRGLEPVPLTTLTYSFDVPWRDTLATAVGDVNADGYADVVLSAVRATGGQIFLFPGSNVGLSATPSAVIDSPAGSTLWGEVVSGAGDVNGDGFADVLVGSHWGSRTAATMHLFLGGRAGLTATSAIRLIGFDGTDQFSSCASAGDFNGDGYADVFAHTYSFGPRSGYVSVYLGGPRGPAPGPTATVTRVGESASSVTNGGISSARGDFNGDGYGDVALALDTGEGVYLFLGSAAGTWMAPSRVLQRSESSYTSVVGTGDVDGDAIADMIAIRRGYYFGGDPAPPVGATVNLHRGSSGGFVDPPAMRLYTPAGFWGAPSPYYFFAAQQ